eukprot:scaffold105306_cov57-Phaeocystis_antarctica.AAC.1
MRTSLSYHTENTCTCAHLTISSGKRYHAALQCPARVPKGARRGRKAHHRLPRGDCGGTAATHPSEQTAAVAVAATAPLIRATPSRTSSSRGLAPSPASRPPYRGR